jgi:hypothetical protein
MSMTEVVPRRRRGVARRARSPCRPSHPGSAAARALAAALLALSVHAAGARAADVPEVSVVEARGESVIEAHAMLHADAKTAWGVLTGYEAYARFVPGVTECRVVARAGPRVTVVQAVVGWWVPWRMEARYDIEEHPPDRVVSQASGTFGRLASEYRITTAQDGVILAYRGTLTPGTRLLSALARHAARRAISEEFGALAREIERQAAAAREPAEGARRGAP